VFSRTVGVLSGLVFVPGGRECRFICTKWFVENEKLISDRVVILAARMLMCNEYV
jgi:hypothetical protein